VTHFSISRTNRSCERFHRKGHADRRWRDPSSISVEVAARVSDRPIESPLRCAVIMRALTLSHRGSYYRSAKRSCVIDTTALTFPVSTSAASCGRPMRELRGKWLALQRRRDPSFPTRSLRADNKISDIAISYVRATRSRSERRVGRHRERLISQESD